MDLKNKAVFIDRDGTINVEKNYLYKKEHFEFIDGVPEALRLLNENGFKVVVITNQAGVAKGYYTEDDIKVLHNYIDESLQVYNAFIDGYYYCPHHPEGKIDFYRKDCSCRKPGNEMLLRAIKDMNISPENSWIIGDKRSDVDSGKLLNIKSILVLTGYGQEESRDFNGIIKKDLLSAVKYIINN